MRGLSTWLFSKVVMFVFLTSVFAIMAGVLALVNERSYNGSAEAFNIQLSDGLEGILFSSSTYSQKVVPIPQSLPEDSSRLAGRSYFIELGRTTSGSPPAGSIYTAISWDVNSRNPRYASSTSVYYPSGIGFMGPLSISGGSIRVNSSEYRYMVFIKSSSPDTKVCIKACKKGDLTECTSTC